MSLDHVQQRMEERWRCLLSPLLWWRNRGHLTDRGANGRGSNLSIVRTDMHVMRSRNDDAITYISRRLTPLACSLITCRERVNDVAKVNVFHFRDLFNFISRERKRIYIEVSKK